MENHNQPFHYYIYQYNNPINQNEISSLSSNQYQTSYSQNKPTPFEENIPNENPAPLIIIDNNNQVESPESLSTPICVEENNKEVKDNEIFYKKKYLIKENLILYIIYFILFIGSTTFALYTVFISDKIILPYFIPSSIFFIFIFICGFRDLCYVVTFDIKRKIVKCKLYKMNSIFSGCIFCCPNEKVIDLRRVKFFWNVNESQLSGNCFFYNFNYYYYLGALCNDMKKLDLIKHEGYVSSSGLCFCLCYLYHFSSRNRFYFDELVTKLNSLLEMNKEYINSEENNNYQILYIIIKLIILN